MNNKKYFLILLGILLLSACSNSTTEHTTNDTANSEATKNEASTIDEKFSSPIPADNNPEYKTEIPSPSQAPINKPVSEYTEADYIENMCQTLNVRYNENFSSEDIKIVNVSKADSDTIFEAVCYNKNFEQEFKVYINQTKLTVTDDYERFIYGNDISAFIDSNIALYPLIPVTDKTIIYAMNSKAHNDLDDYLTNSDTYISFSLDCNDGLNEDTYEQLIAFCNVLIDNNYKFKLKCNINGTNKTYFHDPAHNQIFDPASLIK